MKLLSIIFSIIVFSQTALVDCEMPLFPESNKAEHSCCSHQGEADDTEHQEDTHSCSPFCSMDCCSTPVYFSSQLFVEEIPAEEQTAYFSHLNNYSYSFEIALYHPPRF